MGDKTVTIEMVDLVEGRSPCAFKFYDGMASNVPVLDIGELFASVLMLHQFVY